MEAQRLKETGELKLEISGRQTMIDRLEKESFTLHEETIKLKESDERADQEAEKQR